MLSDSSYITAMCCYIGAALGLLICLGWWMRRRWRAVTILALSLPLAALLLTPAYPQDGVNTLAPALIVAVFQGMTAGAEEAMHALRPLVVLTAAALVTGLLILFLTRLRGRARVAETGESGQ